MLQLLSPSYLYLPRGFSKKTLILLRLILLISFAVCLGCHFSLLPLQGAEVGKTAPVREQAPGLINAALEAYGGSAKVLSLRSFVVEYNVQSTSQSDFNPISAKTYFKDTDQFRSEIWDGNLQVSTVLSRDQSWVEVNGTTISRPQKELTPLRNETLSLLRPELLLLIFSKYRYDGHIKEKQGRMHQIQISGFVDGEYIRGRLSINGKTFLIEKYEFEIEREMTSGPGIFQGQIDYLKYSAVKGFKFPSKILSRQAGKTSYITVTTATLNEPIDENFFRKTVPASRKSN